MRVPYVKFGIDTIVLVSVVVLILGASWFIGVWRWAISPEFIPLHYSVYFGFDRFGPRFDLFLYPVLGTVIALTNIVIMLRLFEDSVIGRRVILTATVIFEIFLFVGFLLTILKTLS